jgi:translation elongation factor EF-1beta
MNLAKDITLMMDAEENKLKKHFKATHKETGEEIFFGLEDIYCYITLQDGASTTLNIGELALNIETFEGIDTGDTIYSEELLKDYHLQFKFKGEYYAYE